MACTAAEVLARLRQILPVPEVAVREDRVQTLDGRDVWSFTWQVGAESGSATVDANTGEVMHYCVTDPLAGPLLPGEEGVGADAARRMAEELAHRLYPDRWLEVAFWARSGPWPAGLGAPGSLTGPVHRFVWVRLIHSIPYPENAITVAIDSRDGRVREVSCQWDRGIAARLQGAGSAGVAAASGAAAGQHPRLDPAAGGGPPVVDPAGGEPPVLDPAAARAAFRAAGAELFWRPVHLPGPWPARNEPPQWRLGYRLRARALWLDARTGRWLDPQGRDLGPMVPPAPAPLAEGGLAPPATPGSQESQPQPDPRPLGSGGEPEEPPDLEDRVRAMLELPPGAPLRRFRRPPGLGRLSGGVEFVYESTAGGKVIVVEPATGLVLRAQRLVPGLTQELFVVGHPPEGLPAAAPPAVVAAACALVRRWYPGLAGFLGGPVAAAVQVPGRYDLFFPRLAGGVPVEGDGVQVALDPAGQWISVHLEWTPGYPGRAAPALAEQDALDRLLALWEPVLVWAGPRAGPWTVPGWLALEEEPPAGPAAPGEVRGRRATLGGEDGGGAGAVGPGTPAPLRLVYRLLPRPGVPVHHDAVDAATGRPLPRWNEPGEAVQGAVAQHPAGRDILALLAQGALTPIEAADPDAPLTRRGALRFLARGALRGGSLVPSPYVDVPPDDPLANDVALALGRGALRPEGSRPELRPEETVTRGEFARLAAGFLGLGLLLDSALQVRAPFPDARAMDPAVRRAAAFLHALGIVEGGVPFRPGDPITVAEAASLTVRVARVLHGEGAPRG